MRAGQQRHRIEIHAPTNTADGMGGFTTTYSKISNGDAWCHIHWLRGAEQIEAMQTGQRLDVKIGMRYRPDVKETMRIVYGNRTFEIYSMIDVEERNIMLEILGKEVL